MSSPATAPQWETFPRAPIVEAVVDLRCSLPSDVDARALTAFQDRVRAGFPIREELAAVTAEFVVSGTESTATGHRRPHGCRMTSDDRRWVVQARIDGFTLSHLEPYSDWKTLRARAVELWNEYTEVAAPLSVDRIAVRYINRIFVPIGASLADYFTVEPRLGPGLPQKMAWFGLQVAIEAPEVPAVVFLQQRRDADWPSRPGEAVIVLDIDAFRDWRLDPKSEDVWLMLDKLRELKNKIFFGATTDKAKEAFR